MKLTLEEVKSITLGAENVTEENGKFKFYRFNEKELEAYAPTRYAEKSLATSGIQMEFSTDATAIYMSGDIKISSSRTYYNIEIFCDGKLVGDIRNFNYEDMTLPYTGISVPGREFDKTIELSKGDKKVRVILPWTSSPEINEIELVDATYLTPIKKAKQMLIYGDSITQGYDALSPSRAYAVAMAYALDAEGINKAIGGEVFFTKLSKIRSRMNPDYITVAYGTNDWSRRTYEDFSSSAEEFFSDLAKLYPDAKIFAISPIWRKDYQLEKKFDFFEVDATFRRIAEKIPNMTVIRAFDFVCHDENLYADLRLHPSDDGFVQYANGVVSEIKKYI